MNWFLDSHNFPFTIAFTIMVCFAVLECISMLFGGGLSQWLSDHTPDMDIDHATADLGDSSAHGDVQKAGFGAQFFSWLECGKLPFLISFNAFLGAFSVLGFTLQGALEAADLPLLTSGIAAIPAFVLALPILKYLNRWLGRIWPDDETSAFSPDEFVGRVGTITIGQATMDRAAEVKVVGPDQKHHYIMAYTKETPLSQGEQILLTERIVGTAYYRGIPPHEPIKPSLTQY